MTTSNHTPAWGSVTSSAVDQACRLASRACTVCWWASTTSSAMPAVAEELADAPGTRDGDVTVVHRGEEKRSLALRDEFEHLTASAPVTLHLRTGPPVPGSWLPPTTGHRLADPEALTALVPRLRDHDVYVCGPPARMQLVHRSLADAGVPRHQVHDERFGW